MNSEKLAREVEAIENGDVVSPTAALFLIARILVAILAELESAAFSR